MASGSNFPGIYQVAFTWVEPSSALSGALNLHFSPKKYLSIAAPNAEQHYHPELQTIMTTIIGGWMIMAFNDAVTLRIFPNDLKIWRCIVAAHLISDIFYGLAIYQAVGFERMVNPTIWTKEDWIMAVGTWPITLTKIAFLLGIGFKRANIKKD